MRLIVDANLAPRVARRLREAGHDAIHVFDIELGIASDEAILAAASADHRVIVSADADFGTLLVTRGLTEPSFVLLRSADHLSPDQQAGLIVGCLGVVGQALSDGAIAVLARGRLRVRSLLP